MLPAIRALKDWMANQLGPAEGKDADECFRAYLWWETLGLCKWLIDGDPAVAEFGPRERGRLAAMGPVRPPPIQRDEAADAGGA